MPFVQVDTAEIYYEVSGDGPAVLLAHGAGGNRLSWWQQVPAFESEYTVIRMDHRGFGLSACEDSVFHPEHFEGDAIAVLDAVGAARAAIVGQSMGGWTALRTALAAPARVACAVLAGSPGGVLTPAVAEATRSVGERLVESGIQGNAALAPDYPAREPELAFLYDQINALNRAVEPAWLGRLFDERGRLAPAALEPLSVPTLLIHGDQDLLFPPEAIEEVAAVVPGAQRTVFPGVGHSTYYEAAPAFNREVLGFIARHLARA